LLITAIVVAFDGRGQVLFRQKRVGQNKKPFYIYKFRTMISTKVPFNPDFQIIEDNNQNLTKVGRVLRRLKIDEIPQLFNILLGQMSFVGPRPLLDGYNFDKWVEEKYKVKPGLSGLAQVNGGSSLTKDSRCYYDVYYAKKISFWLDLKVFFKTFGVVIRGEEHYKKEVSLEKMKSLVGEDFEFSPIIQDENGNIID